MKNAMKKFYLRWYPLIISLVAMLYSIGLGIMGHTDEAQYSKIWPVYILLIAIFVRQRRSSHDKGSRSNDETL